MVQKMQDGVSENSDIEMNDTDPSKNIFEGFSDFMNESRNAFRNDGIHALKEPKIGAAIGAIGMVMILLIASFALMANKSPSNDGVDDDNIDEEQNLEDNVESWQMWVSTRSGYDLPMGGCDAFSFGGDAQEIREIYYKYNSEEPTWWENRTFNEAGEMLTECQVYPSKNVQGEFYKKTYQEWEHSTVIRDSRATAYTNGIEGIASWKNNSYLIDQNGNILNHTMNNSNMVEPVVSYHKIYDGDLLVQMTYNPFEEDINVETYSYDELGRVIQNTYQNTDSSGDYDSIWVENTTYDQNGFKNQEEEYYRDYYEGQISEQWSVHNITKNTQGEIIFRSSHEKTTWSYDDVYGESESWENYSYDLIDGGYWYNHTSDSYCEDTLYLYTGGDNFDDVAASKKRTDCAGNVTSEWVKTFNANMDTITHIGNYNIGENNSYTSWVNYTYDGENLLSKTSTTSNSGPQLQRNYEYDGDGNMISYTYYNDWNETIDDWDGFYSKYEYVWSEVGIDGSNGILDSLPSESQNTTSNETIEEPVIRSGYHFTLDYCEPTSLGGDPHEVQEMYYKNGELRSVINRTWNRDGELLISCDWDESKNINGTFYSKYIYTYQDGNKIGQSYLRANTDGSTGYQSWTNKSWEYDIDGNEIIYNQNIDENGIPETTSTFAWQDNLLIQEIDDVNSTEPEYINYSYDSNGLLISKTNSWIDENGEYYIYFNTTYVRDLEGHILEYYYHSTFGDLTSINENFINRTYEVEGDGYWDNNTANTVIYKIYTDSTWGMIQHLEATDLLTGDVSRRYNATFAFTSEGNLMKIYEFEENGILTPSAYNRTTEYYYDSEGNLLSIASNFSTTGPNSLEEFTYDSDNNLLSFIKYRSWDSDTSSWGDYHTKKVHIWE
ncbi:MAG TPA: hypothetical protein EYN30_06805 [Candidatus Poseidoniales archaeon]|nr:hypothetical protein [Candidatus Poseidoniales archaeon]